MFKQIALQCPKCGCLTFALYIDPASPKNHMDIGCEGCVGEHVYKRAIDIITGGRNDTKCRLCQARGHVSCELCTLTVYDRELEKLRIKQMARTIVYKKGDKKDAGTEGANTEGANTEGTDTERKGRHPPS